MPQTITATGRSVALSFDEAFRQAVDEIGGKAPNYPDFLLRAVVTEIRGEFGGIDGRRQLLVTLTAEIPT